MTSLGVWHVFHQCCQNHWDHVVSTDLIRWKKLPSPVHPDDEHWYDKAGSYDGSAAILPAVTSGAGAGAGRSGPVILVDNIGPRTPLGAAGGGGLADNPGCQG